MSPEDVLFRPLEDRRDLADLVRLQRCYMKLLYCTETARAYERDPAGVLDAYGLATSARAYLPDVASENHRVEMHGRRVLAAQELLADYARTFACLLGAEATVPAVTGAPWFLAWLSSEEFFGTKDRLPHAFGIGPGYENASPFFFHARRRFVREATRPAARAPLYTDFGRWLVGQARESRAGGLARFRRGAFFDDAASGSVVVVTSARQVVSVADEAGLASKLAASGLTNLDEVSP